MNTTHASRTGRISAARIIGTIAAKDIVDALKNRTILAIMIGVLTMLVSIQALPLLMRLDDRPRLAVYDPDRTLLGDLRRSEAVQAGGMRSTEEVVAAVQTASAPIIGLDLPSGLAAADGPAMVVGYAPHWIKPSEAAVLQTAAETELAGLLGRPVTLELRSVYPEPDTVGRSAMLTSGFVLAVMMTSLIVVPFLFLEEREANTLALLTLSPASIGEVVAGKAIAGLTYSLAAAGVLLAFNVSYIVTWPLFFVAILAGTVFSVMLGLLVGIMAESHNSVNLWAVLLTMVLVVPVMVTSFTANLPGWLETLWAWLPSKAMVELLQLSYAARVDLGQIIRPLAVLLTASLVLFAAVTWRCGRQIS
jgi:ABC-2 type transport system permease protein